jgi:hypothetical protein
MKKVFGWIKAHGGVLVGLAALYILALSWLIIFSMKNLSPDAKIQAALMALLIIITGFYALQTQRLVQEEKKRRAAEFGMQRIEKFLRPLLQMLNELKDSLFGVAEASKRPLENNFENSLGIFEARLNKIDAIFYDQLFMVNPFLWSGIRSLIETAKKTMPKPIENQSENYVIPWKDETEKEIRNLGRAVCAEIGKIIKNIRNAYGFFLDDTESFLSRDDLSVLKDRPPTRI